MTTRDPLTQPMTDEENEAAYRRSMAFNAEAVRSGLMAAALDIAAELRKADIPQGEACLMTGAAEFVAQLWQQVGEKAGIPTTTVRKTLLGEIKTFFGKSLRASRAGAPPIVKH